MFNFFKSPRTLADFDDGLTHEKIRQMGRILFVDDETPLLIQELKDKSFAVDHDDKGDILNSVDRQIYDIAIIDFQGVGLRLGPHQGLEVLKYIRSKSPRTRCIAYTSRGLTAAESDFFRLSHAVLRKDLGLRESVAIVEENLKKSLSKENLFEALISKLEISSPEKKKEIEQALIKSLQKNDPTSFREGLKKLAGIGAEKIVEVILTNLFGT